MVQISASAQSHLLRVGVSTLSARHRAAYTVARATRSGLRSHSDTTSYVTARLRTNFAPSPLVQRHGTLYLLTYGLFQTSPILRIKDPVFMILTLYGVKVILACNLQYRSTIVPDLVTLASSNREIWPSESPLISTFREV